MVAANNADTTMNRTRPSWVEMFAHSNTPALSFAVRAAYMGSGLCYTAKILSKQSPHAREHRGELVTLQDLR